MKIRLGNISNSSSSSFIVPRSAITDPQLAALLDPAAYVAEHPEVTPMRDWWEITVTDDAVLGSTLMDNGDLGEYLKKIGVPPGTVSFEGDEDEGEDEGEEYDFNFGVDEER